MKNVARRVVSSLSLCWRLAEGWCKICLSTQMGMQSSFSLTFFFLSLRGAAAIELGWNRKIGSVGLCCAQCISSQTTLLAINNNRFKFWCCARMWAYAYEAKVHEYNARGWGGVTFTLCSTLTIYILDSRETFLLLCFHFQRPLFIPHHQIKF